MANSVHAYRETLVAQLTELQRLLETERELGGCDGARGGARQSEAAREAEAQEARETATALRAHNALLSAASHRLQFQSVSTEAGRCAGAGAGGGGGGGGAARRGGAAASGARGRGGARARGRAAEGDRADAARARARVARGPRRRATRGADAGGRSAARRTEGAGGRARRGGDGIPTGALLVGRARARAAGARVAAGAGRAPRHAIEARRCAADLAEALPQLRALAESGGDDARWEAARAVETAEAVLSAGVGLAAARCAPPPSRRRPD